MQRVESSFQAVRPEADWGRDRRESAARGGVGWGGWVRVKWESSLSVGGDGNEGLAYQHGVTST